MQISNIVRQCDIKRSARVMQLEGLFDIPKKNKLSKTWEINLPLGEKDWQIGLIVGPSGCGKTVIATELFGNNFSDNFEWLENNSILDSFPADMGIKAITRLLSSVGFSSTPSWLKPYRVLSNGEQFRANMARVLAENKELSIVDEFTSVVDRTVAQIGSAAIAKAIRREQGKQFIAVSCHYDIIDWLSPDWIYCPVANDFKWRFLQPRPNIKLNIVRVSYTAWKYFYEHHYLTGKIHKASRCFIAMWGNTPVAFNSVLKFPHSTMKNAYREHRLVCLPDFQGVGIGSALSDFCGSLYRSMGKRLYSRSSHPARKRRFIVSKNWRVISMPKLGTKTAIGKNIGEKNLKSENMRVWRPVISAEYIGKQRLPYAEAVALWDSQPMEI